MLRRILDRIGENWFSEKSRLRRWFPLYEAVDAFLYSPGKVTRVAPHIRDAMDLKRMMVTVVVALVPAVLMALYNTGLQANLAIAQAGAVPLPGWRTEVVRFLGVGFSPHSILDCAVHGLMYFLPLYIVTMAVGGAWEVLFAIVRRHEVSEGFLVTGLLFPLILPPTLPLWMAAVGISFGVVMGKEVFGGVGMNIINPALAARMFLFFAYPLQFSSASAWIAVDGFSRATPLAQIADPGLAVTVSWSDAFLGLIPGSMGETSVVACLLGALVLVVTGVGSWRIMGSVLAGAVGTALVFNLLGSPTNPMFAVPPQWHLVLGGLMFGTVFMATDPVSASITNPGRVAYGLLIGVMVVLIRVVNPAFPEGIMLAILFGNITAPVIDRVVINANVKRRMIRYGLR